MVKGFDPRVSWLYLFMGLGSATLAALAYLATIKCRETDSAVGIVTYFHLIAAPVMGTWSAATWHPMTAAQWGMAFGIGVLDRSSGHDQGPAPRGCGAGDALQIFRRHPGLVRRPAPVR